VKLRIGYVSRNLTMIFIKSNSGRAFVTTIATLALAACGSSPASTPSAGAPPPRSALASMLGRPLLVMPTQYLAVANPAGQYEVSLTNRDLLPIVDEEIADAFRKRGVRSSWTFAKEITESALRQGGLIQDPRDLASEGIRRIDVGDTPLPEPLGSQIRDITALQDSRYVLIPVEVDVDERAGHPPGILRIVLVDARTARVIYVDHVDIPPFSDLPGADLLSGYGFRRLAREIATRFADMVVAQ
jgi:hypothetical protein